MTTKLVVSVDGLQLTNLETVVSHRSIDEVVLVSTSSDFNSLSSEQRSNISSAKASNIGTAKLSLALANESSASLSNDFFNFILNNNISFLNDSSLSSLSSSLVLTPGGNPILSSITGTSADNFNGNIVDFNSSDISSNSLYVAGSSLSLGSNFGIKPTISINSPSFLDDLQGSVVVTVSASEFSNYLNSQTDVINLTDSGNLVVEESTQVHDLATPPFLEVRNSDLTDNDGNPVGYDGTNRLDGVLDQSTTGDGDKNNFWIDEEAISISVSQALRLPKMGVAPHLYSGGVTLKDSAAKLAAGFKAFTEGQISSFNAVEISVFQRRGSLAVLITALQSNIGH